MNKIPDNYCVMAEKICPVCGEKHTHNTEILIHKRLRSIPENKRVTGYGLCEKDDKLYQDGYIAFVAVDPKQSTIVDERIQMEGAYRTGGLAHIRREATEQIFSCEFPDDLPMVFVEDCVIEQLKEIEQESKETRQ